jgi:hypothetical protein
MSVQAERNANEISKFESPVKCDEYLGYRIAADVVKTHSISMFLLTVRSGAPHTAASAIDQEFKQETDAA